MSHPERTTGASVSGYLAREGDIVSKDLVLGPVGVVNATVLLADGVTPSRAGGIKITTTNGTATNSYTGVSDSAGKYSFFGIPVPCSVSLYVEDATGVGVGRFFGILDVNNKVLDTGAIILNDMTIAVDSIDPGNGAADVPVKKTIHILFTDVAEPSSLNSSNIFLTQGANRVAGTLLPDVDNRGVTFIPAAPLKGFTLYTLAVTKNVQDLVWRNLALEKSISSTTIDNIPPEVSSISPANGTLQVAGDAVIRITFSEQLDANSLGGIIITHNGAAVAVRTDLIQNGTVVALTPLEPLSINRTYTLSLSGVNGSAGNTLSAASQSSFATIDTIVPTVTSLTAAAGDDLIKGSSVPVSATVLDSDVSQVDFYLDEPLAGTVTPSLTHTP